VTDFLLELRSEEIPARMQVKAKDDLARLFADEIAKAGLAAVAIETFATPRRLALIARGLPDATLAVSEETKGPKVSAPPQALEGFLRKTGLAQEQLSERDGVYFAVVERAGRPTAEVLAEAIPAIVRAFPWPKSMRWGKASLSTESLRWVRPLQGIVALFGDAIVPCAVEGIVSGATTMGHRFHSEGAITIGGADDYIEKLRAGHVIVHFSERAELIREGARAAAAAAGLSVVPDEGLVVENTGLTEWPVPLLGRFDPSFLETPPEVIQLTMRTNQKYFACTDAGGALTNAFVCTANIAASDGGAAIVAGNERVLSARLADAKFFWENDLQVPLEAQAEKLKDIVFHEKLGTVADKVERVAKLARWLCEEGIIKPSPLRGRGLGEGQSAFATPQIDESALPLSPALSPEGEREELADLAERAARLCKADLVTGMVGEFPELQGIIGGHLARAQGEDPRVADTIRDHYKPVGQGDDVPTDPVTVAVSLADKLDTIFGFAAVGNMPTGSSDPYAIRRAALSNIRLLLTNCIRLPVTACLRRWYDCLGEMVVFDSEGVQYVPALRRYHEVIEDDFKHSVQSYLHKGLPKFEWESLELAFVDGANLEYIKAYGLDSSDDAPFYYFDYNSAGDTLQFVWRFLADRLKVQQREAGVRHDLIDAVFALGGEDDLVRLLARVKALQAFVTTAEGANLLAGYKRAANILKKGPSPLAGEGDSPEASGVRGTRETSSDVPAAPLTPLGLRAESPSPAGGEGQNSLSVTPEPAETALIQALDTAEPTAQAAIEAEDFEAAMSALASLRVAVDAFFEAVMVNDPDPAIRARRLGLLQRFRDAVHRVADFSKIEG